MTAIRSKTPTRTVFSWFILLYLLICSCSPMRSTDGVIPAGRWAGVLQILQTDGKKQLVPMQLNITKLGRGEWSWTIEYKGQEPRRYKLIQAGQGTNHFVMDEGNGILLDGYRIGDSLYFLFEVQGSRLICRYQLGKKYMQMDIMSGRADDNRPSGDTIHAQDTIPPVLSASFRFFQSACLRKT